MDVVRFFTHLSIILLLDMRGGRSLKCFLCDSRCEPSCVKPFASKHSRYCWDNYCLRYYFPSGSDGTVTTPPGDSPNEQPELKYTAVEDTVTIPPTKYIPSESAQTNSPTKTSENKISNRNMRIEDEMADMAVNHERSLEEEIIEEEHLTMPPENSSLSKLAGQDKMPLGDTTRDSMALTTTKTVPTTKYKPPKKTKPPGTQSKVRPAPDTVKPGDKKPKEWVRRKCATSFDEYFYIPFRVEQVSRLKICQTTLCNQATRPSTTIHLLIAPLALYLLLFTWKICNKG